MRKLKESYVNKTLVNNDVKCIGCKHENNRYSNKCIYCHDYSLYLKK